MITFWYRRPNVNFTMSKIPRYSNEMAALLRTCLKEPYATKVLNFKKSKIFKNWQKHRNARFSNGNFRLLATIFASISLNSSHKIWNNWKQAAASNKAFMTIKTWTAGKVETKTDVCQKFVKFFKKSKLDSNLMSSFWKFVQIRGWSVQIEHKFVLN